MDDLIYRLTSEHAANLRKHAAEARARHAAQQQITINAEDGMAPLLDRLKRLIANQSAEVLRQPLPIEFFAERLRGRQKATPNRGELARCLRQLGFTRTRKWRNATDGFRAYWHAPVNL